MSLLIGLAALLGCAISRASAARIVPLDQATWTLDNAQGFGNVSLANVTVPSYALEILQDRGIVGDPLYRWG